MDFPATVTPAYAELVEFLVEKITPEQMLAFKPSAKAQKRADELAEKNKSGNLSADEETELQHLLEYNMLMTALRARALAALKQA
jgi:hypothetical protein